jgi:hypothetical protein
MKTKILLWSVVSVLTAGIAKDTDLLPKSESPQVITLSDGTKLTLLGTTYGNEHIAPKYGYHLSTGDWIRGGGNPIYSSSNMTVVWIEAEHTLKQRPSYELLVSDQANTACVPIEPKTTSRAKEGVWMHGFTLNVFPRRDKETILRARLYGGSVSKERFVISNPARSSFSKWSPVSLPNTQADGDFSVTLTDFFASAPVPRHSSRKASLNDPVNQCVRLDFDIKQNGQPVTNWLPRLVETSDATGNRVRDVIYKYPQDGISENLRHGKTEGYFYRKGLWPSEPAWKVRLEFTRTSSFSEDETLTLTNIPVRIGTEEEWEAQWSWEPPEVEPSETNSVVPDYTVNGIDLKFFPPLLRSSKSQPDKMFLSVVMRPNPNPELRGMRMTLIHATDDQGRELHTPFSPHAGYNCSIEFPDPPRDIKTMNLKFALHKSRHVEFIVKPTRQ